MSYLSQASFTERLVI